MPMFIIGIGLNKTIKASAFRRPGSVILERFTGRALSEDTLTVIDPGLRFRS